MKLGNKIRLSLVTIALLTSSTYANSTNNLDDVTIVAQNGVTQNSDSYTIDTMSSSTKMGLSILETPQSVSVITSQQIEDFNLADMNDVLESTTGIEVQRIESDRARYSSRGFDITNFLVDGIGGSMYSGYSYGAVDTFLYDHIEVTRGATGLTNISGDASAAINMIRKKPTKEFQGNTKLTLGSWNKTRLEADISGAVNEEKTVRTRLMAAVEDSDSYLDRRESSSSVLSGVVEVDINDNNMITFGVSNTKNDNTGTQKGGFSSADTNLANYDVSVNASSAGNYMNTETSDTYLKLDTVLSDTWKLKTTYNKNKVDVDAYISIFGFGDTDDDGDEETNLKVLSYYNQVIENDLLDLTLNGSYELNGREHDIVISANYLNQDFKYGESWDRSYNGTEVDFETWDGAIYSSDTALDDTFAFNIKEKSVSIATNYNASDKLNFLIGSKLSSYSFDGFIWSNEYSTSFSNILTPYLSAIYKINNNISTYASYTTTFTPTQHIDYNENLLDPEESVNYEIGVKSSLFDNTLNTAFSIFKTTKEKYQEYAGQNSNDKAYYEVVDGATSEGFDLEVSGKVSKNVNAFLGYTHLSIKDADGKDIRQYTARNTVNTSVTYTPEEIKGLKVGASANWKSKTSDTSETLSQESFALFNAMASYEINKKTNVALNVKNLTDKKYYNSLFKDGYVTYGSPRSFEVSLAYKF